MVMSKSKQKVMFNVAKYPYAIAKLYKIIGKESSFLAKYFFLLDLSDVIVNYLYFLTISSINEKEFKNLQNLQDENGLPVRLPGNNWLEELEKLPDLPGKLISFIPELSLLKKSAVWKQIKNFDKKKNSEIAKKLGSENYYKKLFATASREMENILGGLSFLARYLLIIPFQFNNAKKKLTFLDLNGSTILLRKIGAKPVKYNLQSLYLMKKDNDTRFFELRTGVLTKENIPNNFNGPNYASEILLNALNRFLCGSNYLDLKINFYEPEILLEAKPSGKNNLPEIYLERPYINISIDHFFKNNNSGYFLITGIYGSGKSTALEEYQKVRPAFNFHSLFFKKENDFTANFSAFYKEINKKFKIPVPEKSNLTSPPFFKDYLRKLSDFGEKQVIIFEDINLLRDNESFFKMLPEKLPQNIYIVLTTSAREGLRTEKLIDTVYYNITGFSKSEINSLAEKLKPEPGLISTELLDSIYQKTYGLPLYCKIILFEILGINQPLREKLKNEITGLFLNLLKEIEGINGYDSQARNFLGLLAIAREGFNISEIKNILTELPAGNIDFYLEKGANFILRVNGRYKLASEMIENLCLGMMGKEEITGLHNKVIDFCMPWDKKVSSLTLKYLPYHFLEANRAEELKSLLETSFVKSKFKIYPQETLEDVRDLIKYILKNQKENLADLTKFCFVYQKLKEETKKELLNIAEWCRTQNYAKALTKVEYINKPAEKFYQLLLITWLIAADQKPLEAGKILKMLLLIPDIQIHQYNSELIFLLCAGIAGNGVLDVINLPRTKEDGINLIKNINETRYTPKLIEVLLKLLDAIPGEPDKGAMLEALISKVSEINNLPVVEKFFDDVMPLIEKVGNINIRDKLYYSYLANMLKKPELYSKLFGIILEKKEKVQTPLFKFLFYGNLALMFLYMNQAKISKDFILGALNLIRDADNINFQGFMFTSIIAGIKYFEKTDFFNELISNTLSMISQVSFSYEKIERSLSLLNSIKGFDNEAELLKNMLKELGGLKEKNVSPLLFPYLTAVDRVKDKRVKNPLLKRLIKLTADHSPEVKVSLFSILVLFSAPNDTNYEILINELETGPNHEKSYHIVMDFIALSREEKYSSKLIEYFFSKVFSFNSENSGVVLTLKVLSILNREAGLANTITYLDKVFMIANLLAVQNRLRIFISLSIVLFNSNESTPALNLLHKSFALLQNETDENRMMIINYLFNNLHQLKDKSNINDYLVDLLTNTFNLFHLFKREEFLVKMISEMFASLVKITGFSGLKFVFFKTLELSNKITNANYKENITGIIRYHLPAIKETDILINILQKTILVSEENFSQTNIKMLSLISIAFLNEQAGNHELSTRLFMSILAELRFFNYEDYIAEVLVYFSENLSRFTNKERAVELFRTLVLSESSLFSDKNLNKVFSEIALNLSKLGEIVIIQPIFELLLDKSLKIRNEQLKVDYLVKLLSFITNFGLTEETKPLIKKILTFKNFITENQNLVVFFRAFIISLNKLNNPGIIFYLEELENNLDPVSDIYLKAETLSLIATAYYKYRKAAKSNLLFDQAVIDSRRIYNLQNQIDYIADLTIRLFTIGKEKQAKSLLDYTCTILAALSDQNQKYNYISRIIHKFSQLRSISKFREQIHAFFEKIIIFDYESQKEPGKRINLLKLYILLARIYFKFNEPEYSSQYFKKAKNILSALNETPETVELMISLGIAMIQSNEKKSGNNLLKDTIVHILIKPKKIKAELGIKLFSAVMPLGELQYDREIFNEIMKMLDELVLEELSENDLFTLGFNYAYKNNLDKFFETLSYIKSKINRERLLRSVVSVFKEREDFSTLILLLPDVLDDSKTLDLILATLLSLVNDPEQTKKITDTIIIY
jgi:hypothetical protein